MNFYVAVEWSPGYRRIEGHFKTRAKAQEYVDSKSHGSKVNLGYRVFSSEEWKRIEMQKAMENA